MRSAVASRVSEPNARASLRTLDIACAADGAYVPHCAAMMHSVLAHRADADVRFHYLCTRDFPRLSADLLTAMVERCGGSITFVEATPEQVRSVPRTPSASSEQYGTATWLRIFLPEVLPELDRILYLDADAIALDSLAPLLEVDLGDSAVAAVTNLLQPNDEFRRKLNLTGAPYFNGGVMIMNLDLMRREHTTGALLEHAHGHREHILFADQDTLNAVLGSRRLALHPRWNVMNGLLEFDLAESLFGAEATSAARREPAVRHFEGPAINKPWHILCERGLREAYFRHRRQTPWPRVRRDGVTARNLARLILRRAHGLAEHRRARPTWRLRLVRASRRRATRSRRD